MKLLQKKGRVTSEIELKGGDVLAITTSDRKNRRSLTIRLADVFEEPLEVMSKGHQINREVVAGGIVSGIFALPFFIAILNFGLNVPALVFLFITGLAVFATFRAYRKLREGAFDVKVYRYRGTGSEAFYLNNNLPDPESFRRFEDELLRRIKRFSPQNKNNPIATVEPVAEADHVWRN